MYSEISERALFARINRVLAKSNEALRKCRQDSRAYQSIGPYYIVDVNRNSIIASGITDLKDLAKDEGVSCLSISHQSCSEMPQPGCRPPVLGAVI